jgi:aminoglycoside phosphotransferase (APT) family kinase protein
MADARNDTAITHRNFGPNCPSQSHKFDPSMIITPKLVQNLVEEQFPQWVDLSVTEVIPNGWDNRTFRLGDEMSVRLPSAERYVHQVQKEHTWLPKLAPLLQLPIPTPIAIGEPGYSYPWQWSVNGWIEGETAAAGSITDLPKFAQSLANFLISLQKIDPTDAPVPGLGNRGGDLAFYNDESLQAIEILEHGELGGNLDVKMIKDVWDAALDSQWTNPPIWIHGDISLGNVLVENGELSAVIDFGGICIGDPSCDLAIAWTTFKGASREAFRRTLNLDDATWSRARGWTLWKSLITYTGISETNTVEARTSRRTITRILSDHSHI